MRRTWTGCLAGLILALAPAAAHAGPTVTVRVEGERATLLERTSVTLPDTAPPVAGCQRWTPGAALEEATRGNWDRQAFTQSILGESHTFTDSDYWAEWLDRGEGYRLGQGVCNDVLEEGDEVLMLVDRSPPPGFLPTAFPLDLEGVPATVQAGAQFTVTVLQWRLTGAPGSETRVPVEDATVTGGGGSATTGADGTATLRLDQAGTVALKATKAGAVVSGAERVVVTAAPAGPAPPTGEPPAPVVPTGGAAADTTAPRPAIARLRNGLVLPRRRAPRLLRGTVAEPGGVRAVELSIVRRRKGRCAYWSARRERFRGKACDGPAYFAVGANARWSYLLPARLPAGRYYIRVAAVDAAGNRGSTRVVIQVR